MIEIICVDGVFKAKGSFSLGIVGTFVNEDFDGEAIQIDEDLLEAILDEDDDVCEPFMSRLNSDDPDEIAKVLTDYYNEKERKIARNAKQINDCVLYCLFRDMEGCGYPFWKIKGAVLPGFLENHAEEELNDLVYKTDGTVSDLYEYFEHKPNDGTLEKPNVEALIRKLYPMFNLDGFIKSFKPECVYFNGEFMSFQFSDGWGARIACAAYDELDENFTSTDWHNN